MKLKLHGNWTWTFGRDITNLSSWYGLERSDLKAINYLTPVSNFRNLRQHAMRLWCQLQIVERRIWRISIRLWLLCYWRFKSPFRHTRMQHREQRPFLWQQECGQRGLMWYQIFFHVHQYLHRWDGSWFLIAKLIKFQGHSQRMSKWFMLQSTSTMLCLNVLTVFYCGMLRMTEDVNISSMLIAFCVIALLNACKCSAIVLKR